MADRDRPQPHQLQIHPAQRQGMFKTPRSAPSAAQIIAIITLLPVGGTLLCLAGLTLAGSLIGLALTTPLFVICSPVLVPAAFLAALAVTGFLTSGAFGLTGLSSLSWVLSRFRQQTLSGEEPVDFAKRRMQEAAVQLGQKTKDIGQRIESKAHEAGRPEGATREAAAK